MAGIVGPAGYCAFPNNVNGVTDRPFLPQQARPNDALLIQLRMLLSYCVVYQTVLNNRYHS